MAGITPHGKTADAPYSKLCRRTASVSWLVNACRAQWTCERRILLRCDWRSAARSTRGCGGRAFTMGLTPHVRLASPPGGEGSIGCRLAGDGPARCERVRQRPRHIPVRTRPTSPSTLIGPHASDNALDTHRHERVRHRLCTPSVRTRSRMPSTPIGTKPVGLVYPSPRLPLRSCGYLGFRTQPPLNPVGVVYAVTCGFTSALKAPPDPHWAPQIHPESITVRAHLSIIGFAPQPPQTGPPHTPIRSPNRSLTTTTAFCPRRPARPLKPPSPNTVTYFPTMS
jgi:hypothetical protein